MGNILLTNRRDGLNGINLYNTYTCAAVAILNSSGTVGQKHTIVGFVNGRVAKTSVGIGFNIDKL